VPRVEQTCVWASRRTRSCSLRSLRILNRFGSRSCRITVAIRHFRAPPRSILRASASMLRSAFIFRRPPIDNIGFDVRLHMITRRFSRVFKHRGRRLLLCIAITKLVTAPSSHHRARFLSVLEGARNRLLILRCPAPCTRPRARVAPRSRSLVSPLTLR